MSETRRDSERRETIRVLFLTRSLERGGAERQLVNLACGLRERGHAVRVASFYSGGPFARTLREHAVDVVELGKRGRWDLLRFGRRLLRAARTFEPNVVHGYLVAANLLARPLSLACGRPRVVWGVRASDMDLRRYSRFERLTAALETRSSRVADRIFFNSEAGRRHHARLGYPESKLRVVPNGIDVARFAPRPEARGVVRSAWGVPVDARVVGRVARLDPMKDAETFLDATGRLCAVDAQARVVAIGSGADSERVAFERAVANRGLEDRVIRLDRWDDMTAAYAGFDVATSTSAFGEGFSNALAEAMACGLPCVSTDVGDARRIVGELGIVVPPKDPIALADGWRRALDPRMGAPAQGAARRSRIVERFSVERLVARTERELLELVGAAVR